jgi:thiol-disulfide isomerase/thioredoxin
VPVTILILVAVLVAAAAVGLVWRRRLGRVQPARSRQTLTATDLNAPLGSKVTLVQFSTPVCQPCRVTRGVLGTIAEADDGVRHVEIDAEQRLDLVRRLNVLRTPTVFGRYACGRRGRGRGLNGTPRSGRHGEDDSGW